MNKENVLAVCGKVIELARTYNAYNRCGLEETELDAKLQGALEIIRVLGIEYHTHRDIEHGYYSIFVIDNERFVLSDYIEMDADSLSQQLIKDWKREEEVITELKNEQLNSKQEVFLFPTSKGQYFNHVSPDTTLHYIGAN